MVMPVLIEGISVVVQVSAIARRFPGGVEGFRRAAPNDTLCADNELARVGFMAPGDVQEYVHSLEARGLLYKRHDKPVDLVVVDQQSGPTVACDWIEFGHVALDGDEKKRIAVCSLAGSTATKVFMPTNWKFETSLSASFQFVPTEDAGTRLKFLRHEGNVEVYLDTLTGKEVLMSRTSAR
jgi:hypothetical protein